MIDGKKDAQIVECYVYFMLSIKCAWEESGHKDAEQGLKNWLYRKDNIFRASVDLEENPNLILDSFFFWCTSYFWYSSYGKTYIILNRF